jgi:2-hydroxy-3-keto-5-methylthiopentenyl-1-phosphate phosphatase
MTLITIPAMMQTIAIPFTPPRSTEYSPEEYEPPEALKTRYPSFGSRTRTARVQASMRMPRKVSSDDITKAVLFIIPSPGWMEPGLGSTVADIVSNFPGTRTGKGELTYPGLLSYHSRSAVFYGLSAHALKASNNTPPETDVPLKIDTGGKRFAMVFDFDGTITEEDVFDSLFYRFAHPDWLEAHRDYHHQVITMEEAYLLMTRSFTGSVEEVRDFVRKTARLRKGFKRLLEKLRGNGTRTLIISNGFDLYLFYLLDLWEVDRRDLEIRCHHAEIKDRSFIPAFRQHVNLRHDQCLIGKAEAIEELQAEGYFVAFAGNGLSDTPASHVADLIFARAELADYCRKEGIDFIPFRDFFDLSTRLFGNTV